MEYPEEGAVELWEHDGLVFSIQEVRGSHYCGYVRFPVRPVQEPSYNGIMTYVPVHGGITYARSSEDGSIVYGFDCAHADDDKNPELKDIEWLMAECETMAQGIKIATEFEQEYLANDGDDKARADVLDRYHQRMSERGVKFEITDNFGAMINAMFGGL